ncbi:MAG: precorrin-8X methylmutase [Methanoregulaceae archaeon]|nr:precorrin-8X methylmutase [Methanoregulaceae archaeon]
MSKESSPRGVTTGNTYTDLGASTAEALEISRASRALARERIGDADYEDRIRQRCSIAVGDFSMAGLLRFHKKPVEAGLAALSLSAPLITDIRMVQVGIQKKGHTSPVLCALDYGAEMASAQGITRSRAGIQALGDKLEGSVIVIGNAPSALLAVCDLVRDGCRPALVIGTPVGFVKASESKEELRTLDIPSVSNEGTRGGTPVAVAAINEIITIYAEITRSS